MAKTVDYVKVDDVDDDYDRIEDHSCKVVLTATKTA